MYKVIIIEDNMYLLESLRKNIEWASVGCALVGIARDGENGEKLVHTIKPDIIISDIRMPGRDGLEMLESIQSTYPNIQIIIISAYEDFSYAKRAIRLNVVDYLTKPIQIAALLQALSTALLRLEKERSGTVEEEAVDDRAEYLHSKRQKLIYSLLSSYKYERDEWEMHAQAADLRFSSFTALMINMSASSRITAKSINTLLEQERNKVKRITVVETYHQGKAVVWFFFSTPVVRGVAILSVTEVYSAILKLAGEPNCLLSPNCFSDYTEIPRMFSDLDEQLSRAVFSMNLSRREHSPFPSEDIMHLSWSEIREVLKHYQKRFIDRDGSIEAITSEFIGSICAVCQYDPFIIKMLVCRFLLNYVYEGLAPDKSAQLDASSYVRIVEQATDTEELSHSFCIIMQEISDMYLNSHLKYSQLVSRSLDYIYRNANAPITLNKIAEQFFVTPSYLSVIIKKETGKNYLEILTEVRIKLAKSLLLEQRHTIHEIANIVQYKNYINFYKVFKKVTGMTPKQYRESGTNGDRN